MKRLLIGIALLMFASPVAVAGERTVTLAVANMTCALCPITVSKAIEGVDGVTEVSVEYAAKRAIVRFDDAVTSWERIAQASTNAGFPASKAE
jgi:mercuric ion binding protein